MEASVLKVNIKWGKTVLNDVELDLNEDVLTFKSQIYALTNVPVDKQKIMMKGKVLKVNSFASLIDSARMETT